MSWWERQYKKFLVGGIDGVDTASNTVISATDSVTVESLGILLVVYEDEFISHNGDPIYIQTR